MAYDNDALMAAAAQMLSMSGPSRQPVGLGQILGGGMGAYKSAELAAKQRKLEEDQARQMAEMRALQMQEMQGGLDDRESARTNAQRMAALKAGFNPQARQAPEIQLGSMPMNSSMGQPQAAAPQSEYDRRMAYADYLRSNGAQDEGDAAAKEALQFMPKVKEWSKVRDGGRVKYAPLFDNGQMGAPVDREIAEKLEFRDAGGSVVGLDAYSGATKSTIKKTATIADGLANRRLALDQSRFDFDKTKEAKPQFSAELGGFISPPSKANPNGGIIPLAGAASKGPKMTEDQAKATGWLVQAENAFGNMKAAVSTNPGAAKPGFPDFVAGIPSFGVSGALAQTMRGTERQKFMQGASSLSESLLRAATGAGVNKEEAEQKVRELTPVFGDDDATIQQKMEAVPLYIESLKVRAGPGAKLAAGVAATKAPAAGGWSIKRKD